MSLAFLLQIPKFDNYEPWVIKVYIYLYRSRYIISAADRHIHNILHCGLLTSNCAVTKTGAHTLSSLLTKAECPGLFCNFTTNSDREEQLSWTRIFTAIMSLASVRRTWENTQIRVLDVQISQWRYRIKHQNVFIYKILKMSHQSWRAKWPSLVEEKGFPNAFQRGISTSSSTDTRNIVWHQRGFQCYYMKKCETHTPNPHHIRYTSHWHLCVSHI